MSWRKKSAGFRVTSRNTWEEWSSPAVLWWSWFPWSQRYYVGAAFGTRTFQATATESITGLLGKVEVKSTYIAPEIGWRFIWESGFFMGIDLGWQIITSDTATFDIPAAMPPQDKQDLVDAADDIGKTGFPVVSLFQVGFYL